MSRVPDARVVRLPADVTFATAPAVVDEAAAGFGAGGAVRVDLSACTGFDSALVAVLLELRRRAAPAGVELTVDAPPANLRKLAALYGVEGLLLDR